MAGIGQFLYRTFFWSYERGSWQYDVAVILILVFVFTPKNWFHDQPQVGLPVNSTQVELLSKSGEVEAYAGLRADHDGPVGGGFSQPDGGAGPREIHGRGQGYLDGIGRDLRAQG